VNVNVHVNVNVICKIRGEKAIEITDSHVIFFFFGGKLLKPFISPWMWMDHLDGPGCECENLTVIAYDFLGGENNQLRKLLLTKKKI